MAGNPLLFAVFGAFAAFVSFVFLPSFPRTGIARVCTQLPHYYWDEAPGSWTKGITGHPSHGRWLLSETARTYELSRRAYVNACLETFEGLAPEVKAALAPVLQDGIPEEQFWQVKRENDKPQRRQSYSDSFEKKPDMTDEMRRYVTQAVEELWDGAADIGNAPWHTSKQEMLENFLAAKPSEPPYIDISEIPWALANGIVARFDATKIFPGKMFNASVPDIAKVLTEAGKEARIGILDGRVPPFVEFTEVAKQFAIDPLHSPHLNGNLRHLAPWYDTDIPAMLNMTSIVEREMPTFNVGITVGLSHYDEQDNILVGVKGVNVINALANSNLTDVVHGYKFIGAEGTGLLDENSPRKMWHRFITRTDFVKDYVPNYVINLKPGDGMTLPSRVYHAVWRLRSEDLAMNAFMEPKFGEMRWESAPQNYFTQMAKDPLRMAIRTLWVKSAKALYDKTGGCLFYQGVIEYC